MSVRKIPDELSDEDFTFLMSGSTLTPYKLRLAVERAFASIPLSELRKLAEQRAILQEQPPC